MTITQRQLAHLGLATEPSEPVCWRTTRLDGDGPASRKAGADPAKSRALLRWRMLLAHNPRRGPYRISRVED